MPQGKPLANWMFEANQRAQNQHMAEQNAMVRGQLLGQAAAVQPPEPTRALPPTHNWQHSDDLAAQRAMGLERQANKAALDKDKMALQMALRARYAKHAGSGAGPQSKDLAEYAKVWDRTDFPTPEHQKARLTELTLRIKGRPGGARELQRLAEAHMLPEHYGQPASKGAVKADANKAVAEDRAARRQTDEQRFRASALGNVLREKVETFAPGAEQAAKAKDIARQQLMDMVKSKNHDVLVRDKKTGQVMQYVPDDEEEQE